MTITLTAGQEKLLGLQLKGGKYKSAREVIDHALAALQEMDAANETRVNEKRRSFLGGIFFQDLVNEGADAAPKTKSTTSRARLFVAMMAKRQQA